MKSTKLINLKREIQSQGNVKVMSEYFTEHYLYSLNSSGEASIFIKYLNEAFRVSEKDKVLTRINNDAKVVALAQIKQQLSSFDVYQRIEPEQQAEAYEISARGEELSIQGQLIKCKNDLLVGTSHAASYHFVNKESLVSIPLAENEIIVKSEINLMVGGQQIKSNSSISDIIEITEQVGRFDYLLNYRIAS